jgi:2'-hydroxyisoflavone reductase
MKKKILIIGGSYFVGRVFVEELLESGGYDVYVLNRGNIPIRKEGVTQLVCDRRGAQRLRQVIPGLEWDAVVDFCAYTAEDISLLMENLPAGSMRQYIYISTASVYASTYILPVSEEGPLLTGPQAELDPVADYAYHKLLAEYELRRRIEDAGGFYTIIRPAFIYGKFNYAPRESHFFDLLHSGEEIVIPENGLPLFSLVSVWDMARILRLCIGNNAAADAVFNAAAPELISYPRLVEELEELEPEKFRLRTTSMEKIISNQIPLPFPVDEHLIYDGSRLSRTLDFSYTPFTAEFERTYYYYKIGKGWE